MPKEVFKNGKLTLKYDAKNEKDKIQKLKQDLKKDKGNISNLSREELELIILEKL